MNFRSFDDMASCVRRNVWRLDGTFDAVVGIPRSGTLPANLIALHLNVPMTDVEGVAEGRILAMGHTRRHDAWQLDPARWKRVLVVDDSIASGRSMHEARQRLRATGHGAEFVFCAIYGIGAFSSDADIVFETCLQPRMFEWNFLHHELLSKACVEIDDVLCFAPPPAKGDTAGYRRLLANAMPKYRPTKPIGTLVSARLEKYRPETEDWLHRHSIEYNALHLLDLPRAGVRRSHETSTSFKTEIYRQDKEARIFIDSDLAQVNAIAAATGKAALCIEPLTFIEEPMLARAGQHVTQRLLRPGFGIRRRLRHLYNDLRME